MGTEAKGFLTMNRRQSRSLMALISTVGLALLLTGCASAGWVKSVTGLCLQVEQSYTGVNGHSEPIAEELQGVFERMGIRVIDGTSPDCQATLYLKIEFSAQAVKLTGGGECYPDVTGFGQARLTSKGQPTLTTQLLYYNKPSGGGSGVRVLFNCPKTPYQANYTAAWGAPVASMLKKWWGNPALESAMQAKTYALQHAAGELLSGKGTATP
jgi:hypothetical protein